MHTTTAAASAAFTIAMAFAILAPVLPTEAVAASRQEEQRCLALTMYFEARGEGRRGMIAVAWTVLNRVRSPEFPGTPCAVVFQGGETPPCQFSWWCDGRSDVPREARSWRTAQMLAADMLVDPPPDPTGGALYFHSTQVRAPWRGTVAMTTQIGTHVFYR